MIQPSFLRQEAANRLRQVAYNPKRLVLLHTAIALGSSLLTTLISYLLSLQIAETGGLSGMTLRSVLATAQSVLELAVAIGFPFWNIGLLFAILRWTTGQAAVPADLLQGFRRFFSVLGLLFLRAALFLMLAIGITNISSTIYMMTPFATPLVNLLTPLMQQGSAVESLMTDAFFSALLKEVTPLIIVSAVPFLLLAIPLFYRLRFADFAVIDGLSAGKALLKSFSITPKKFWPLLKLDLSFWWFYLLQMLSVAICYADSVLQALGISLPVSPTVAAFGFYIIGLICQGILLWQFEASRLTVYGLAYRTLDGTIETNCPNTLS